jgi:hypothetical protein
MFYWLISGYFVRFFAAAAIIALAFAIAETRRGRRSRPART